MYFCPTTNIGREYVLSYSVFASSVCGHPKDFSEKCTTRASSFDALMTHHDEAMLSGHQNGNGFFIQVQFDSTSPEQIFLCTSNFAQSPPIRAGNLENLLLLPDSASILRCHGKARSPCNWSLMATTMNLNWTLSQKGSPYMEDLRKVCVKDTLSCS